MARYPKWMGWAGMFSMAVFQLPLLFNRNISFYKLMGSGKNGSFDKTPDLRQWALLTTQDLDPLLMGSNHEHPEQPLRKFYGAFIYSWWRLCRCEIWTMVLEPIEGHGTWDGKQVFGPVPKNSSYEGPIAVLTRATIRLNKLSDFWAHVDEVAATTKAAPGFIGSFGIGEVPWIKQATFSLWQSKAQMRAFAYQMQEHAQVVAMTRKRNWYSEEMFVRFRPIRSYGGIKGIDFTGPDNFHS